MSAAPTAMPCVGALRDTQIASGQLGAADVAGLEDPGFTEQVGIVKVSNRGRLPVSVTGWSIDFLNGVTISYPGWQSTTTTSSCPTGQNPDRQRSGSTRWN